MIPKEVMMLQKHHQTVNGFDISLDNWASGLIIKLLEIAHGQWQYCNLVVHNEVSGALVNKKKEELRDKIEEV